MLRSNVVARTLIVALTAAACSQATPATRPEPRRLAFTSVADSIIIFAQKQTHWGVEVWDQARNESLWSFNADRHFVPASNTKLVVTTVAMGTLGPDWRYETPFMVAGAAGDSAPTALFIKGTGDPTWSARFFGNDFAVPDMIADSLVAKGIRRIAGDLIVDASAFHAQRVHSAWEIGDLPWYYAAPTAAFAIGEAALRMIVTATDVRFVGGPAPTTVVSRVRTDTIGARNNIDVDYEAWPDTLLITGSIAPNRADSSWIAMPDPEHYAAQALVTALNRKQIEVTGRVRILRDSAELAALPSMRTVMTFRSAPLHEIAGAILKPSQNWIAEQLLKTLGYTRGSGGSWRDGLAVERRYLIDVVRIDSTAFSLSDGSGLSAQTVVSPRAFVQLLEHARTSPWGRLYHAALPSPGLRGGTLSTRLTGLESRLAAKTGTIANVNSLGGYLRTSDGRDVTFSIMTNASGRPAAEMRRAIDALVQAIARERAWE